MSADQEKLGGPVDEIRYFVSEMPDADLRVLARRVLGIMLLSDGRHDAWAAEAEGTSGTMVVDGLCEVLDSLRLSRRRVSRLGRRAIRAAQPEVGARSAPARRQSAPARSRRT